MNAHGDLVGRLAQLRNIVSKPELNEAYVLIQAYLPDKDRFSVRTLPSPISNASGTNIAIKLSSLALCTPDCFADRYPRLHEVQVVSLAKAVRDQPEGTTLKLVPTQQPQTVMLSHSHRCVGEKVVFSAFGTPEPVTRYFGSLHISPTSNDAVIEFEDIHFIGVGNVSPAYVTCMRGRSTIFRRCAFSNIQIVVAGNAADRVIGTPNVVFESCVMDAEIPKAEATGVCVGNYGKATLLNCVIRNCGGGVLSTAGATVVMRHCLIENCLSGVGVKEKTKTLDMQYCNVSKNLSPSLFEGYGILVDSAGPAVIRDCSVRSGQEFGICLRGKSKHLSHVTISDSLVSGCQNGVCFQLGVFEATINATVLQCNLRNGLCIDPAVAGTVAMNQCSLMENQMMNVQNSSPAKGMLTIDGVVQEAVQSQQPYELPAQLAARRCGQRAGICDINCLNCGRKEETGEKFKKCGKCEDVCYCSRECQKTHWKEHKKTCKAQENTESAAVAEAIRRYEEGSGSLDDLRVAVQKCNSRKH